MTWAGLDGSEKLGSAPAVLARPTTTTSPALQGERPTSALARVAASETGLVESSESKRTRDSSSWGRESWMEMKKACSAEGEAELEKTGEDWMMISSLVVVDDGSGLVKVSGISFVESLLFM